MKTKKYQIKLSLPADKDIYNIKDLVEGEFGQVVRSRDSDFSIKDIVFSTSSHLVNINKCNAFQRQNVFDIDVKILPKGSKVELIVG